MTTMSDKPYDFIDPDQPRKRGVQRRIEAQEEHGEPTGEDPDGTTDVAHPTGELNDSNTDKVGEENPGMVQQIKNFIKNL